MLETCSSNLECIIFFFIIYRKYICINYFPLLSLQLMGQFFLVVVCVGSLGMLHTASHFYFYLCLCLTSILIHMLVVSSFLFQYVCYAAVVVSASVVKRDYYSLPFIVLLSVTINSYLIGQNHIMPLATSFMRVQFMYYICLWFLKVSIFMCCCPVYIIHPNRHSSLFLFRFNFLHIFSTISSIPLWFIPCLSNPAIKMPSAIPKTLEILLINSSIFFWNVPLDMKICNLVLNYDTLSPNLLM